MGPIETLLAKIAFAVLKKAVVWPSLSKALAVISVIDACATVAQCVETVNDCHDAGVIGLRVVSDHLPEMLVDRLLAIGSEKFTFQRTSGGLYVASKIVPAFAAKPGDFPQFGVSVNDFPDLLKG